MKTSFITALAALAIGLGGTAAAQTEPAASALAWDPDPDSYVGVVSSVEFHARAVKMGGAWVDETVHCDHVDDMRVRITITWSNGDQRKRKMAIKTRMISPCGNAAFPGLEDYDGTFVGFWIVAKKNGFACPSGAWRPGTYRFRTITTDLSEALTSEAHLVVTKTESC